MRARSVSVCWALWLGLVLVGTAGAALPTASAAARSTDAAAARVADAGREVVLRGTLQRYAATGRDGSERVVLGLRSQGRTYRLEVPPSLRVPRTGSRIEVAGRLRAGVVGVTRLTRLAPPAPGWGRAVAGRAPSHTRVLVMRVYSTRQAPAKPTTSQIRSAIIGDGDRWFEEVSHGRYSIGGTATPWLKVKGGSNCAGNYFRTMERAIAKAKRKGFPPKRFGRFIMYMPCSPGFMAGLGEMPGSRIWLFGYTDLATNVHEQGHNLGLRHANARQCRRDGQPVTWSGSCTSLEYGDTADVMGNRSSGHYNAFFKSRLGWLQKSAKVTGSTTRTLTPAERTSAGLKALRVRAGDRTYWVELRGGTGADADLPEGTRGVQIRLQRGAGTELLDAMPGTTDPEWGDDWGHVALPEGSSWTSPEKVRITVRAQDSSAAEVAVKFGAGRAKVPAAPSSVTATVGDDGTTVSWARPDDRGSIITKYTLTASPGGVSKTVRSVGGLQTSTRLDGLPPGTEHTVTVRAHNAVGASAGTVSQPFVPVATDPAVSVTSPASGATVTDPVLPVSFTTYPAGWSWDWFEVTVDGGTVGSASPGDPLEANLAGLPDGVHSLRVVGYSVAGTTVSAPVSVTLDLPQPTVAFGSSPAAGSTVAGEATVDYALGPPGWPWSWVSLEVEGLGETAYADAGQPLLWDTTWVENGTHRIRLVGYDEGFDGTTSSWRQVTVEN